ncbi:hypothetical protein [Pedobacter foliorum]|uniref:hypothetical protein n=1 Tax=Pedobacter foliorum TaxID=2739058 RepID=UPI0015676130|nr:hypothetical protein [Pedobacter foliorum]NRF37428.1 hypothetical protein [Pedobacter foliorum]
MPTFVTWETFGSRFGVYGKMTGQVMDGSGGTGFIWIDLFLDSRGQVILFIGGYDYTI